jgi:uncharacterized protein YjiS (DUF1127 family)
MVLIQQLKAKAPICAAGHILCRQANYNNNYWDSFRDRGAVMSTMNLSITVGRARQAFRWSHVQRTVAEWHRRLHSRAELSILSDRCLQDIGLSHGMATFEAAKPFWMA